MRFLIALALTLIPALAHATEEVRWQSRPDGTLEYWSLHSEPGQYVLDRFVKKPGAFQDLSAHRAFASEQSARQALDSVTAGFHAGKPPRELFLLQGQPLSVGSVWETREAWSWEWEQKFSAWLAEETGPDFFRRHGISTDCADAAYAFRWIFARIHGLPAANHLSVSDELFTNESLLPDWQDLPTSDDWQNDQRFRAALDYLLRNTYTHSLMTDLYPVEISRAATLPGTIFLHLYNAETGHTEILFQVLGSSHPSPLRVVASNVPREVRELAEYGMLDWGSPPKTGESGLLRFLWAQKTAAGWRVAGPTEMPFYSEEQYSPDFIGRRSTFVEAVTYKLLPNWKPDSAAIMREKTKTLTEKLGGRVKIVADGFRHCSSIAGGCPEGSADWETWSTPSRDAAIGRLVHEVQELEESSLCNPGCEYEFDRFRDQTLTEINDRVYSAGDAFDTWKNQLYSSDPNATIPARWGR